MEDTPIIFVKVGRAEVEIRSKEYDDDRMSETYYLAVPSNGPDTLWPDAMDLPDFILAVGHAIRLLRHIEPDAAKRVKLNSLFDAILPGWLVAGS